MTLAKKPRQDLHLYASVGLVFFLGLLFSAADAYLFLTQQPPLDTFTTKLVAHFIIFAGFIALFNFFKKQLDKRFLLTLVLFSVTLGPWGAITILVSMLLYLIYMRFTVPLTDLLATLMPPIVQDQSDIVYERILYHLDDFHPDRIPIPFKDIMAFGSYKQKRMAIEKILRYYRPEFASALKAGLEDKSSAVKVQAATALSYIDHKLFDENVQLKKICDQNPDDHDALKAYALHTQNYVYAEILDSDRYERMLQAAIQAYTFYLKKKPDDLEAKLSLAQLLHTQKNEAQAKILLNEILEKEFSANAALLMMKVLYNFKNYEELYNFALLAKQKLGKKILHDQLFTSIQIWTEGLPREMTQMGEEHA